ncbi:MAG TPA: ROK family protein [Bacteroidetes bacterium]|nr:ROK family protein [Bacteroidota bacterium]
MTNDFKVIGIDLGGTNLKYGIFTPSGELDNLAYRPAEAQRGPERVIEKIIDSIDQTLTGSEGKSISGIGVGVPGQVDRITGVVRNPPNFPGWESENLREIIERKFDLPTYIDNDANAAALGESVWGGGKNSRYFALITLGTGVGCGLILDNKVYHGVTGAAGEFGHTVIKYDGPVCLCGQRGCIERYVGAQWIVKRAVNHLSNYPESALGRYVRGEKVSPKVISRLANEGDCLCRRVIEDTGDFLGIALGSLVNLLNPDLILIGGGVANAGTLLFDAAGRSLRKFSLPVPRATVKIEHAVLGENAGVIGAAQLAIDNLKNSV